MDAHPINDTTNHSGREIIRFSHFEEFLVCDSSAQDEYLETLCIFLSCSMSLRDNANTSLILMC